MALWYELKIKAPFGEIACKVWGDATANTEKFIALHGFMDNAGSFDPLMECFLTEDRCVVCVDFLGHGLSSHLPVGIPYGPQMDMPTIRFVVEHLKWSKYNLLAHSLGALRAQLYTFCFPEDIKRVICLDAVYWPLELIAARKNVDPFMYYAHQLDNFITKYCEPQVPRRYPTKQDIMKRWETGVDGLNDSSVEILMIRGAKQLENGDYVFTRHSSLHARMDVLLQYPASYVISAHKRTPHISTLFIRARQGFQGNPKKYDMFNNTLKLQELVTVVHIDGTHYVHMEKPLEIANIINDFMETPMKTNSGLPSSRL